MRPELAALVVHDLKNALGILEAQLLTLEREPGRALAGQAHLQCAEMRRRFMMFLTLYGADNTDGELRAHCADESPQVFLRRLLTLVARPEGAALVHLGDCDSAPPFWFFDFRLVRMALEAALHNAWRFARHQIVVSTRQEAGWLVFTIEDDGPGLDGSDIEGTGDSTQSAEITTTTGLGTELCHAVARAHSSADRPGRVTLTNREEGGTRFELWLS
ncbi:HAMP domain-containing sensor histidine kinase [soil metagenome]